jgi:hypothetical protein
VSGITTADREAAIRFGKLGGRPKGSRSSPLAIWLVSEIRRRKREDDFIKCREAFDALADCERPINDEYFYVSDYTADQHDMEIDARVTFRYFRKLWREIALPKPVSGATRRENSSTSVKEIHCA